MTRRWYSMPSWRLATGRRTGTAFAGIVAGPNKVMRRVARRDLITWDADVRGYRMDPADAEIVLQRWPAPPGVIPAIRPDQEA